MGSPSETERPHSSRRTRVDATPKIDLWWKTGDERIQYLHIANAKWRGSDKVDQGEVSLLEYVRGTADFVADTDATGSSEHPKRPIAVDFRKVTFWIVSGMAGFEWRVGVSCCWFRLTDDGGSRPTSGHIRRYESCLKAAAPR